MRNGLVVLQCGFPWDWVCDFEQQTARILSKRNTVIAFYPWFGITLKNLLIRKKQLLEKKGDTLYCFYPLYIVPFTRIRFIHQLNQRLGLIQLKLLLFLMKLHTVKNKMVWFFPFQLNPKPSAYGKNWRVVYDCVDYVEKENKPDEIDVIMQSDILFTPSKILQKSLPIAHSKSFITPLGFDQTSFEIHSSIPHELTKIPKPWIVYIGNINERLDYSYLIELIPKVTQASFVFIGPITKIYNTHQYNCTTEKQLLLFRLSNVHMIPQISKKQIAEILHNAAIGIIPYDTSSQFNRFSYPMKIMEYLYAGLPVVATPLETLKQLHHVFTSNDPDATARAINYLLRHRPTHKYRQWAKRVAEANSWYKKLSLEMAMIRKHL